MTQTIHDVVFSTMLEKTKLAELLNTYPPLETLTIRAVQSLYQDQSPMMGQLCSYRMLYQIQIDDFVDETHHIAKLIEDIIENAPNLVPFLYYLITMNYVLSCNYAVHPLSLRLLDYQSERLMTDPLIAPLIEQDWIPESEIFIRHMLFYLILHRLTDEYAIAVLPFQLLITHHEITQTYLNDENAIPNLSPDDENSYNLYFIRLPDEGDQPPWSDFSYTELLRRWSQWFDTLTSLKIT